MPPVHAIALARQQALLLGVKRPSRLLFSDVRK